MWFKRFVSILLVMGFLEPSLVAAQATQSPPETNWDNLGTLSAGKSRITVKTFERVGGKKVRGQFVSYDETGIRLRRFRSWGRVSEEPTVVARDQITSVKVEREARTVLMWVFRIGLVAELVILVAQIALASSETSKIYFPIFPAVAVAIVAGCFVDRTVFRAPEPPQQR